MTYKRQQQPNENHDGQAIGMLTLLSSHYERHVQRRYHGWGGWGYAVLRTVYTPESDVLFPLAMERLKAVVRWWVHYYRFPMFGPACEQRKVLDTRWNDEVADRFWLDVVEDKEGLEGFDSDGVVGVGESGDETRERETDERAQELARFEGLAEYFRQWCEGVDTQSCTGDVRDKDPRFTSCLVVDAESLAALAQMDEELPPLRCPATREEKAWIRGTGYPGWLWMVEARYMALPAERRRECRGDGGDAYPGWLRVLPEDLSPTWANHWSLNDGDRALCLEHVEKREGSRVYAKYGY
jgi:hypothetical protein